MLSFDDNNFTFFGGAVNVGVQSFDATHIIEPQHPDLRKQDVNFLQRSLIKQTTPDPVGLMERRPLDFDRLQQLGLFDFVSAEEKEGLTKNLKSSEEAVRGGPINLTTTDAVQRQNIKIATPFFKKSIQQRDQAIKQQAIDDKQRDRYNVIYRKKQKPVVVRKLFRKTICSCIYSQHHWVGDNCPKVFIFGKLYPCLL